MGRVVLRSFRAGEKVRVAVRTGDFFPAGGSVAVVKTVSVPASGELDVSGFGEGTYWAVGDDDRRVSFTVRADPADLSSRVGLVASPPAHTDGQAHDVQRVAVPATSIVIGARSSRNSRAEAVPKPNQADVHGVPQRSDTPVGEAHPKDIGEEQPRPAQENVKGSPWQRSDTPLGEATVKSLDEVEPGPKQEDVAEGTPQRSDTELGEAAPKGTTLGSRAGASDDTRADRRGAQKAAREATKAEVGTERAVKRAEKKKS